MADTGFEDVAEAAGIAHPRTSGLAVADVDRDGDLDVVVGSGTARCAGDPTCPWTRNEVHLYRNDAASPSGANVLEVRLAGGEGTNRAALGARVRVTTETGTQTRVVDGGYGHFGIVNDLVLHFGLGAACRADLEVRWPDAGLTTETFSDLPANALVEITQGGRPVLHALPL